CSSLYAILLDASNWLKSQGIPQWNPPYPLEVFKDDIKKGTVYSIINDEHIIGTVTLKAEKLGKTGELFEVRFSWDHDLSFAEVLHGAGVLPLPPYLNRESETEDENRYQTIYAKQQGSVAAPTAGLHFTDAVFKSLSEKNITSTEVTLHVGAGTFKPIKAVSLEGHEMHEETLFIPVNALEGICSCLRQGRKIIAVGTTSTRTLESLYWHGVKLIRKQAGTTIHIRQWDAYETDCSNISPAEAIEAIISNLKENKLELLQGSTQIIIAPGYQFKLVDILITNFHQPENTLILLIAAFVGDNWRTIYEYALDHHFRFLSYGDSSVLYRNA
ncbi:MAG: S-adenosylmethionine:tRNA ribosyltransferase-isomerase, partial [Bacteroidota bacterium]